VVACCTFLCALPFMSLRTSTAVSAVCAFAAQGLSTVVEIRRALCPMLLRDLAAICTMAPVGSW